MARSSPSDRMAQAKVLRDQARRLVAAIERSPEGGPMPTLHELGLEDVALPRQVLEAAADLLHQQANGEQPEIVIVRENLSAQEAANLLGVSRPHLNMLLDRERIPYTTTPGRHRRIKRADIEAHRDRQQRAYDAMHDSMAAAEQVEDSES